MAASDIRNPQVELPDPLRPDDGRPRQKAVTIGAVCKALHQEFPDVSISKIRQELAGGRAEREVAAPSADGRPLRRATVTARDPGALYSLEDVVEETGADPKLVRELVEFGVIKGEVRGGARYYDETEREIVRAVSELARYGVGGRNLRVFRSSADREAQLLQSILAPALRSRNPERRKEAIEALENLASVTTHLKHLLLIRDLRKIAT
jgi:hypothetical protein